MPAVHVNKTIDIKVSLKEVFPYVTDFKQWPQWSPWIIMEPDTKLTFGEKSYQWDGKLIGSGEMVLTDRKTTGKGEGSQEELSYDLFIKEPFKSEAKVKITLLQEGLYTSVTWELDTDLPAFLFFMKNKLTAQVGMDYTRGLTLLKDLTEMGRTECVLKDLGEETLPEAYYLTVSGASAIDLIAQSLEETFSVASQLYENPKVWTDPEPIVIYDKFDPVSGHCVYRVGIPIRFKPEKEDYPKEFSFLKIPERQAYVISHLGAYHHLANAWALGMQLAEKKEFKLDKDGLMIEIYKNDSKVVESPAELLTHICLPIA